MDCFTILESFSLNTFNNVFIETLILFNYFCNLMYDNGSVKWVTKICIKYFMAGERAWKAGKFVLNNYAT
jgi:hypothetical protein